MNTNPKFDTYYYRFSNGNKTIQADILQWDTIGNAGSYIHEIPFPHGLSEKITIGENGAAWDGVAMVSGDPAKRLAISYRNRNVDVFVYSSEYDLEDLKSWANLINQRLDKL